MVTLPTSPPLHIVWTDSSATARAMTSEGVEPVECAFGEVSVLGGLCLDHHGAQSWREGVAIRCYRDHFAERAADPRFVVTGAPDADATFAIAALSGCLPDPAALDLNPLTRIIDRIDTDPIGVRLTDSEEGRLLLLWNWLASGAHDAVAFHAGVDRWRALCRAPQRLAPLLAAAGERELLRVQAALAADVERVGERVALIESDVWGFDVWYDQVADVVVRFADGHATVGCRDHRYAVELFGEGGLQGVFSDLEPAGWGGREAIGGSPRDARLSREQALEAAHLIAARLQP